MHKLLLIYTWFVRFVLFVFPDAPLIMRFRGFLYSFGMKKCGVNFQVTHDANIKGLEMLSVGDDCFIGNSCKLLCHTFVTLENQVQLGPNVVVVSGNHTLYNGSYRFAPNVVGPIRLCFGSWVGANSTILCNTQLPSGSVLAANSILRTCYEETNSIYAGVPAKFISKQ